MRLPRFRITVRRLMIVVALTGLALGGWVTRQRMREYQKKAKDYETAEQSYLQLSAMEKSLIRSQETPAACSTMD